MALPDLTGLTDQELRELKRLRARAQRVLRDEMLVIQAAMDVLAHERTLRYQEIARTTPGAISTLVASAAASADSGTNLPQ
jgi:hypothetical protein